MPNKLKLQMSDPSTHLIERGRKLFAGPCDFVKGVVNLAGLPDDTMPEVAFAGRSNVGKSSLINALTGRKTLARASNTPGRTRELNFFNLGGVLYLVDLPGYGYARASKSDVKKWTTLTRDYLRGRASLRRVCLLIDSRRGLGAPDEEIMAAFGEAAVTYQIILTKADKLKAAERPLIQAKTAEAVRRRPAAYPDVLLTSAEKGDGIAELRAAVAALAD